MHKIKHGVVGNKLIFVAEQGIVSGIHQVELKHIIFSAGKALEHRFVWIRNIDINREGEEAAGKF